MGICGILGINKWWKFCLAFKMKCYTAATRVIFHWNKLFISIIIHHLSVESVRC
jgi:hypothetical protein